MRRSSMSGHDALVKLRPKSLSNWKELWAICGYVVFAIAVVTVIFYLKQKHQKEIEQTWQSATATIEDVRPVTASRVESQRGSAMLYQLEVLARYSADGTEQKRWIRVEQQPTLLADAELKAFRWKGKQCLLRWQASQPDQVIAEVN